MASGARICTSCTLKGEQAAVLLKHKERVRESCQREDQRFCIYSLKRPGTVSHARAIHSTGQSTETSKSEQQWASRRSQQETPSRDMQSGVAKMKDLLIECHAARLYDACTRRTQAWSDGHFHTAAEPPGPTVGPHRNSKNRRRYEARNLWRQGK
jgi:hypothetical protein